MAVKSTTRNDVFVLPRKRSVGDRTSEKKRLRRQVILQTILNQGPISRAEIARRLEFNPQTVKLVVPDLIREGLIIEEQEEAHGQMGRPASPCRINPEAAMIFGIHQRGGNFNAVALDLTGNLIGEFSEQDRPLANPTARANWIAETCKKIESALPRKRPLLTGAAIAIHDNVVMERETYPSVSVPAPGTPAFMIRREAETALATPVLVDNKSRLLALNSLWFSQGKQYKDFIFFDLGETFRATIVINGKIVHGTSGSAGDLGTAPVSAAEGAPEGPMPKQFDDFLSINGFAELAKKMGMEGTMEEIAAKAEANDAKAREILTTYARHMSFPCSLMINLFNPEAIIIGGPMCPSAHAFMTDLQEFLYRQVDQDVLARTDIVVDTATAAPNAEAMGAAALVFDHIYSTSYSEILDVV